MATKLRGLTDAIDAYHVAEVSSPPGLDAGEGIFENDRLRWGDADGTRGCEKGVGRWLACEMLRTRYDAVDARVEQIGDAGRLERLLAMLAGRDDCRQEACFARCFDIANRSVIRLHALLLHQVEQDLVLAVG